MNYYIDELLDYLDIYKVLIEKNLYDPSRIKNIEEISTLINKLNNCYNYKTGIDEYDYSELRRKLMSVFHPDVYKYKIPKEFGFDNTLLISKVNAVLDNIGNAKKEGLKYDYKSQESYSDEDIFEEEMYDARKDERREKRKEFADRVKDKTSKVLMYMKERINASLFHIPSNAYDYDRIIDIFEKDLKNLDFRKIRATETINMLKDEKKVLETVWHGEIDRIKLATRYQRELKIKENVMINARFIFEGAKKKLDSYVSYKYSTKYDKIMRDWKRTSDEKLKEYLDEKVRYSNRLNGYVDENDKRDTNEIKQNLKKLEREYDQYPKYEEMKKKAIETLTKDDKDYKELRENAFKYEQNYLETQRQYDYYVRYKDGIINGYKKQIDDEYSAKRFKTDLKIKYYEAKLRRINNDIMKNIEAREIFETRYKYNFENYTGEVASGFQR